MLSISARLFDPLGLSSPVLLRIKLYFQKLWEFGTPWDLPIPEDIQRLEAGGEVADRLNQNQNSPLVIQRMES